MILVPTPDQLQALFTLKSLFINRPNQLDLMFLLLQVVLFDAYSISPDDKTRIPCPDSAESLEQISTDLVSENLYTHLSYIDFRATDA